VSVSETTVTIPTYPFKDYLVEQLDPLYNIPVYYFDRPAYQAANPGPTPVTYTGVVLENRYLRLTFLPELGGRLYSAVVKSTGQEIFYHNPVVKPSRYGVLQPAEANWWLATGGMEWAYPVQEHGYRFGVPWRYSVNRQPNGVTISLSDTAPDRVGVAVDVWLAADSARFRVSPKLINNMPEAVPVQLWSNAALALSEGAMSPQTQFIVPADAVTVHSRGGAGWDLPNARQQAPWPRIDQTDLSDYSQWADYLGFFVSNRQALFIGAHNPETDLGIVRLPLGGPASGSSKLFAFGQTFPDRSYTDDGSQYFEIWGGANAGFWPENDIMVPAGQTLGWQESWWPLAGLGGLTWATESAAIYLEQSAEGESLRALVSRPTGGVVTVRSGDTPLLSEVFWAEPASLLRWHIGPASQAPLEIEITDNNGLVLLHHQIKRK